MKKMASTEAKNNFGELLDSAQHERVSIEKNGRPVAVLYSFKEHNEMEKMKLDALQRDLQIGIDQADNKQLLDADKVFDALLSDLEKKD